MDDFMNIMEIIGPVISIILGALGEAFESVNLGSETKSEQPKSMIKDSAEMEPGGYRKLDADEYYRLEYKHLHQQP